MKKHILFAAGAMLAAVLMTGCGSRPQQLLRQRALQQRQHKQQAAKQRAVRLRYLQITRLQARP